MADNGLLSLYKYFFINKNKIIYLTKKPELLYLFLLFEIFDFEILATNYGSPVNHRLHEIKVIHYFNNFHLIEILKF